MQEPECELMGAGTRTWQKRREKEMGSGRLGGGGVTGFGEGWEGDEVG